MEKYKVLFLIDCFDKNAGASYALEEFIKNDYSISEYMVLCTLMGNVNENFNIKRVKKYHDIIDIIKGNSFDFIHYFKSTGYSMFEMVMKALDKSHTQIPILTTVCQQPNIKNLLLSPMELKNSKLLIFIDKTAYFNEMIGFIPESYKRLSYLGHTKYEIDITQKILNERKYDYINHGIEKEIIFGRGSTLNKCHPEFIKIFNSIDYSNKKFYIVGIKNPNDIRVKQDNIEVYGILPLEKWLEKCSEFDIFLYVLPKDAYSSVDGTLGHAMLLEKPVVYFGPDAPKERFINGYNGFIADTLEEIPSICEKLIHNSDLRKSIGENARQSTINDFSMDVTINNYHRFYKDLLISGVHSQHAIHIPLRYLMVYYRNNIKRIFRGTIKKVLTNFGLLK